MMTDWEALNLAEAWDQNGMALALAVACLGFAAGQSRARWGRVIALVLFPVAVGLSLAWVTGSGVLGWAGCVAAFLVPFVHLAIMMAKLRVARHRRFNNVLTMGQEFQEFHKMSRAWEDMNFVPLDDCEMLPSEPRHVLRFLTSRDRRYLVTLGWLSEGQWVLTYAAVSSWSRDGTHWMTWNYPLPYGLMTPPDIRLWRCPTARDADALLFQQIEFLRINEVDAVPVDDLDENDTAQNLWQKWIERQMDYNLRHGWLQMVGMKGDFVAYSWRGMWGATRQALRALVGYP